MDGERIVDAGAGNGVVDDHAASYFLKILISIADFQENRAPTKIRWFIFTLTSGDCKAA